jgi:hypothetical protein
MSIADLIRQNTLKIRDSLEYIKSEIERISAERDAADQRTKRCSTEITRNRAIEGERKKSLSYSSERITKAQELIDELDRKRQEAIENLLKLQNEQNEIEKLVSEAQIATEGALKEIGKEKKIAYDAENRVANLNEERLKVERSLKQTQLQTLDIHLQKQAKQLLSAFYSQDKKSESAQAYEEFKKARHSDPEISQLSEQREELLKFVNTAMVPGVKKMLHKSLMQIEENIEKRFPGALSPPQTTQDSPIDEMLYFCNNDGKSVFFFPIQPSVWSAANSFNTSEEVSNSLCLIWNFLRELKLKSTDGLFKTWHDWPIFISNFDIEEVAILHDFNVKCDEAIVTRFILTAVPAQLQEALSNED